MQSSKTTTRTNKCQNTVCCFCLPARLIITTMLPSTTDESFPDSYKLGATTLEYFLNHHSNHHIMLLVLWKIYGNVLTISNTTNKFSVLPAGVVDLGRMDIDVRGDRFVHEWAKTEPKVWGIFHHTERQSYAHRLQLGRSYIHRGRWTQDGKAKYG